MKEELKDITRGLEVQIHAQMNCDRLRNWPKRENKNKMKVRKVKCEAVCLGSKKPVAEVERYSLTIFMLGNTRAFVVVVVA